jgi:RNA polymerase-binding transcription factor DksA
MSDKPIDEKNEKTRYSDEELQEFRELLTSKLEASQKELEYLQEQIKKLTSDPSGKSMSLEDGTGTLEKEYLNQMASRQISYIRHLQNALIRIENKVYGICRVTGKLISKERLRIVPHATLSIEAKKNESKNKYDRPRKGFPRVR